MKFKIQTNNGGFVIFADGEPLFRAPEADCPSFDFPKAIELEGHTIAPDEAVVL